MPIQLIPEEIFDEIAKGVSGGLTKFQREYLLKPLTEKTPKSESKSEFKGVILNSGRRSGRNFFYDLWKQCQEEKKEDKCFVFR